MERIAYDGGDRVWDGDACQRGAFVESIPYDGGDRVWDGDACQRAASPERIVSDGGYRVWNGHSFHFLLVHPPFFPRIFSFSPPIPRHNRGGAFWDVEVPICADANGSHLSSAIFPGRATDAPAQNEYG